MWELFPIWLVLFLILWRLGDIKDVLEEIRDDGEESEEDDVEK